MFLGEAAKALNGQLAGRDCLFSAVTTDSRTIAGGELFIALRGPHFDGHHFLPEIIGKGASGAVVEPGVEADLPLIEVTDTLAGLGELAAYWRKRFSIPIVAVTGSNGKTTVKEMVGAILGKAGPGLVAYGNLNNHIGLPLSLLRLRKGDTYAVVEMGMNHSGEIAHLALLAKPTVAVINNAAPAHLEGLGSVADVARAKAEIIEGLDSDGTVVINADDHFFGLWQEASGERRVISFGANPKADVYWEWDQSSRLRLHTPLGEDAFCFPLPGDHNAINAAAAAAAAIAAGATLDSVVAGLKKSRFVPGRLERKQGVHGCEIWDDSYNANPDSLAAALQVISKREGEKILVLGDMRELGSTSNQHHQEAGKAAKRAGVSRLYTLGTTSGEATQAFGQGACHFSDIDELIEALRKSLSSSAVVLVKGSRGMTMERVVSAIDNARGGG